MRINVYSQELTKEVTVVEKVSDTGIIYYGIRMFLASSDLLHDTIDDDDRSAITFWVPTANSFTKTDLSHVFSDMAALAFQVPELPKDRRE
jgi:hypothetical protein